MDKKKVLFLCTHNSSRSQMAEGIMNQFLGDRYQASSAGTQVTEVNSFAKEAMKGIGVDIGSHYSKHLDEIKNMDFDQVVTVCDSVNENCPVHNIGGNHIHKGFNDPTAFKGNYKDKLNFFKNTGIEIKEWILTSFD